MMPMRISLEQFPPSIGRSCTSTVFVPCRAAEIAAQMPESPPPTTTKSADISFSSTTCEFASVRIGFVSRPASARSLVAMRAPHAIPARHAPKQSVVFMPTLYQRTAAGGYSKIMRRQTLASDAELWYTTGTRSIRKRPPVAVAPTER